MRGIGAAETAIENSTVDLLKKFKEKITSEVIQSKTKYPSQDEASYGNARIEEGFVDNPDEQIFDREMSRIDFDGIEDDFTAEQIKELQKLADARSEVMNSTYYTPAYNEEALSSITPVIEAYDSAYNTISGEKLGSKDYKKNTNTLRDAKKVYNEALEAADIAAANAAKTEALGKQATTSPAYSPVLSNPEFKRLANIEATIVSKYAGVTPLEYLKTVTEDLKSAEKPADIKAAIDAYTHKLSRHEQTVEAQDTAGATARKNVALYENAHNELDSQLNKLNSGVSVDSALKTAITNAEKALENHIKNRYTAYEQVGARANIMDHFQFDDNVAETLTPLVTAVSEAKAEFNEEVRAANEAAKKIAEAEKAAAALLATTKAAADKMLADAKAKAERMNEEAEARAAELDVKEAELEKAEILAEAGLLLDDVENDVRELEDALDEAEKKIKLKEVVNTAQPVLESSKPAADAQQAVVEATKPAVDAADEADDGEILSQTSITDLVSELGTELGLKDARVQVQKDKSYEITLGVDGASVTTRIGADKLTKAYITKEIMGSAEMLPKDKAATETVPLLEDLDTDELYTNMTKVAEEGGRETLYSFENRE